MSDLENKSAKVVAINDDTDEVELTFSLKRTCSITVLASKKEVKKINDLRLHRQQNKESKGEKKDVRNV